MERLPVHRLDLSTLNGLSVRSPEEACVQLFQEARRNVPAVIYLPLVCVLLSFSACQNTHSNPNFYCFR